MLCYCLKYRKNAESKTSNVASTKNGEIMLLLKCALQDPNLSKSKRLANY